MMTTHGKSHTVTYNRWARMIYRCTNPNSHKWARYGGRGIKVCDRWRTSFENFLYDMGEHPPLMSLERLDNEGDYCPENCIWATAKVQARNRRNTPFITVCGKTIALTAACEIHNVNYNVVNARRRRGATAIEAFLYGLERPLIGEA